MSNELEQWYNTLNELLEDICGFLTKECQNDKLSAAARKKANALIQRSKTQLQEMAKVVPQTYDTDAAYVDMQRKDPVVKENIEVRIIEPIHKCPYADLPARDLVKETKHGNLSWKTRFLIHFETMKDIFAGIHIDWLLIYKTNRDMRPVHTFDLTYCEAKDLSQDKQGRYHEKEFELYYKLTKKKYVFTAQNHKDMVQWVARINVFHENTDIGECYDEISMKIGNDDEEEETIYDHILPLAPDKVKTLQVPKSDKPPPLPERKNSSPISPSKISATSPSDNGPSKISMTSLSENGLSKVSKASSFDSSPSKISVTLLSETGPSRISKATTPNNERSRISADSLSENISRKMPKVSLPNKEPNQISTVSNNGSTNTSRVSLSDTSGTTDSESLVEYDIPAIEQPSSFTSETENSFSEDDEDNIYEEFVEAKPLPQQNGSTQVTKHVESPSKCNQKQSPKPSPKQNPYIIKQSTTHKQDKSIRHIELKGEMKYKNSKTEYYNSSVANNKSSPSEEDDEDDVYEVLTDTKKVKKTPPVLRHNALVKNLFRKSGSKPTPLGPKPVAPPLPPASFAKDKRDKQNEQRSNPPTTNNKVILSHSKNKDLKKNEEVYEEEDEEEYCIVATTKV